MIVSGTIGSSESNFGLFGLAYNQYSNNPFGSLNLFLKAYDTPNDNLNLYVRGALSSFDNLNLFATANNSYTSSITCFTNGIKYSSNKGLNLILRGSTTNSFSKFSALNMYAYSVGMSSALNCFVKSETSGSKAGSLTMYIKTSEIPPNQSFLNLYAFNNGVQASSVINMFLGGEKLTQSMNMYCKVNDGTNDILNMYTSGESKPTSEDNLNLYTMGPTPTTDNLNCYIKGSENKFGSLTVYVRGIF